MSDQTDVAIVGYGAYVPRYRLRGAAIANTWRSRVPTAVPVEEKSVPGPDEDTVTMAIEAARSAVARAGVDPGRIGAVWVGTESKPYAVKPSSTIVAEAIGATPEVSAADFEFACKAGSEAMRTAVAFVAAGMAEYALAIGMDTAQARPGDALEYTAGAGGAAFLFGRRVPSAASGSSADDPARRDGFRLNEAWAADGAPSGTIARVEGSCSYVTDTPDFFRREHMPYPEHGHRFTGHSAYFHHTREAARRLLASLGAEPRDYRWAVFHQPNPKFARKIAAELGFTPEQTRPGLLVARVGNTYAGSSLLGLAGILDAAMPGERIFFVSYGSGAGSDAFSFVAGDALPRVRDRAVTVHALIERRESIEDYGSYLRLRRKIRR